ncbi:MAG TPA: hypothetical protein PK191_00230 [Niabella sp.]|nr:hypothetical protein [Niabella sp.]HOZ96527.1 hypothetical protein [Niabella sp.]HQW13292.1 hypothetical protein [Niabella sp.]HQX18668.1 hypothetical protein [Niabella sp.]HQX40321.1 hypothetical protein [Niabella sp.]
MDAGVLDEPMYIDSQNQDHQPGIVSFFFTTPTPGYPHLPAWMMDCRLRRLRVIQH